MNKVPVFAVVVSALLALLATGCGGRVGYDGPERFAVSGTINLDGAPLDYGSISFLPTDESKQRVAGGEITDGTYSIEAKFGPNAGAYRVVVSSIKRQENAGVVTEEDAAPTEEATEPKRNESDNSAADGYEPSQRIASGFSDPESTSLTAEIEAGENVKDFDVTGSSNSGSQRGSSAANAP